VRSLLFLVTLIIGFQARALVEGSTYFYRQTFPISAGSTCSQDLEKLTALLFGSKDEHRHLAAYSAILCGTDKERPLLAEVLFEPSTEEDLEELEQWVLVLEGSVWAGESLNPSYVDSIFWDVYGQAIKADGSFAGTFEKPRVAITFGEIVAAKDEMKIGMNAAKVPAFHEALRIQLGDRGLSKWQKEILPMTKKVAMQFGIYFLTGEGSAERSSLNFQLERDCSKLSCF